MPKRAAKLAFHRNVVPDQLDLRDRPYLPAIRVYPKPKLNALHERKINLPVLDQGDTSACTGFALSNVINFLLLEAGRAREVPVAPFMLYSMARRYDEFAENNPGGKSETKADTGSSLRGGMKGWYKHGACASALWQGLEMPAAKRDAKHDWWQDAARRPLGAYYRVDHRSVADMHVALSEVGILYASAVAHTGWDEGTRLRPAARKGWRIPMRKPSAADGGHAFAIVGYDDAGFLLLNSWGAGWGDGGFATLTYEDWLEHAMDCWVAQLGVVTDQHLEIASSESLRVREDKRVVIAGEPTLRDREIAPFVIDMEKDGRLSTTGVFRTSDDDLKHLIDCHVRAARARWKLGNKRMDVAIYAHGGLTGEGIAAQTAAQWIPALYERQIFPIFLMWETDLWSTLKNQLEDVLEGQPQRVGGIGDALLKFWNERLERTLAAPGSILWGQMKQNARAIGQNPDSGAHRLYEVSKTLDGFRPDQVRLHLIGHSAGAIVQARVAPLLAAHGYQIATASMMAPAIRADEFQQTLLPEINAGRVGQYYQFHLRDEVEQRDPTCKPILGYSRSLLYLVSQSFEGGIRTPIVGMQKYFDDKASKLASNARIHGYVSPSACSASTTHGGFDEDAATRASVIACIKGRPPS